MEAGLEAGDIILGTPDRPFETTDQLREWTMLSPRDVPLPLVAVRPAGLAADDLDLRPMITLRSYPAVWPELPAPPKVGEPAPPVPASLQPFDEDKLPVLTDSPHLLFFWATWCLPCKRAVPEVLAYAADRGITAIAITDESAADVERFLTRRKEPFFEHVAVDPTRKAFTTYNVSGTPTILIVNKRGVIEHVQVGYEVGKGLLTPGWRWIGAGPRSDEPAR